MKQYPTFPETEALLCIAINLRGRTVRDIADASGAKENTV